MRIFNIDITRKGISPVVQVTEHDAMSRFFTLILRNGNADYEPPENPSYSVWYKTKDSTGWYDTIEEPDNGTHPAVVASGNMFTIEIAEAATTSCGELALMITGDDGYQLTVTGILTKSADIPGYDSSEVENYYNVYITRMQENAARAENAAATAIEYGATVEVDETAQQLIITHTDNTEDVQTWVTEAEAWAVGQRDGVDVPSTDETYHNNAKYYAQAAAQSAASLTVDTELSSTSTNPVQNKVIDATVTELKNDLEPYNYSVTDNLYSPKFITNGYSLNINTGDLDVFATHSVTDYIPVTVGETLYASCQSTTRRIEIQSSYVPRICFYDAEKVFIANSGVQDSHATVPLNAKYMRFSSYILPNIPDVMIGTTIVPYITFSTIADDYRDKTTSLGNAINSAQNDIRSIAYVDKIVSIGAELTWTSGYVTAGGNIRSSDSYHYSELISVTPGDVISTNNSFRFVTAYVNGSAVESMGAEYVTSYTVPDTVTAVIVTLGVSQTLVNHTYKVIFDGLAQHVKAIEDKIDGATFDNDKTVFRATAASLTNGEMLEACSNIDNKKGDTITFYANLVASGFGSVTVGHGYNMAYGASVTVDATTVTITSGTTADYYHANHGLTIDKFLMIKISHTDNARADIQIATADGQFSIAASHVSWGGCKGDVFALSTNSTLSDVKLTSDFADFERDIFLFGDSYVGLGDNARYATVLINNGYTNLMIDGWGGRNSSNAILSFRQVIAVAKPELLIWALGMNDADTSSAINSSYKSCLDEVIATCEAYGITPILTTIPNTPTRLHTYKNAYVHQLCSENDYRCIDFAKAVGAEAAESGWWAGMLNEDNVHPTELGAQALYARFLIDVPEIANLK